MKVIFLDFDGVLNSAKYLARVGGEGMVIDPVRMDLLQKIVKATGAKIVLSTSWREHWSEDPAECDGIGSLISSIFRAHGLQILGKTPQRPAGREHQIKCWLDAHPETESFVVLDDMLLYADYLEGHFVKTSNHFDGLDESDTARAIAILTKEVQT